MKKISLLILIFFSLKTFSQDKKKQPEKVKTKMEVFTSKTGVISKYTDFNLDKLKTIYSNSETRIRKLSSGNIENYFYQIEKQGKYGSSTASIEYSDLLETIKALNKLASEVDIDLKSEPDYMENKFISEDGFQLGYYISKNKANWFIKLEKFGSDKTLFIKDLEKLKIALQLAKSKIEKLKSK
ncbi:hypothetical protein [Polaribacter cellanae]|uniref:Uncharacterized protein n=1 Tax=Polaribacter cellanae TaxID=2818493 RepID=A0A975CN44_9FLAO|nr:hypothetical protein [Polaribacter cellanae]QTE22673.1 hypothetical protein J3359_18085 [Polaribacter cellanae]